MKSNKIRIALINPEKNNALKELEIFIRDYAADIYVFPEGFLKSEDLKEALDIIQSYEKYVILGLDDRRTDTLYETALIIDQGEIAGEYKKNILTIGDRKKNHYPGNEITCINTKFGKIGIPICYEIHFPEVSRIMALEEPVALINIIGTGMFSEIQYSQWITLARARAIENEVFVFGCSHFNGKIPVAFAISPNGELLCERKNNYGAEVIEVDLFYRKEYNYLNDRVPDLFVKLSF